LENIDIVDSSKKLLEATWRMKEDKVAKLLDYIHDKSNNKVL